MRSRMAMRASGWAMLAAGLLGAASPAWAAKYILYAGSYTAGTSKGIYAWRFDTVAATMAPLGLMATTPQAAHLWAAPDGRTLYTVNWEKEGGVSAFRVDPRTARLTPLGRVSAAGAKPNQIVLDPGGRIAASVNYDTGEVAVYRVLADGRLSDAVYVERHAGTPLSDKQAGPHAHGIAFAPDGRTMYVAELGLDRIYSYRIDAVRGTVTPGQPAFVSTHAGAGPRRLQISPDGRFLYVNHETDNEVSVYAIEGAALRAVQTISSLPADYAGGGKSAEIILSADGRFLYVSNRGHDSIAVYAVDRAKGRLALKANVPAGGATPRNLRLDPTGGYLVSANEGSGTITLFRIDRATGMPTLLPARGEIDTPGGLYFVKAR